MAHTLRSKDTQGLIQRMHIQVSHSPVQAQMGKSLNTWKYRKLPLCYWSVTIKITTTIHIPVMKRLMIQDISLHLAQSILIGLP